MKEVCDSGSKNSTVLLNLGKCVFGLLQLPSTALVQSCNQFYTCMVYFCPRTALIDGIKELATIGYLNPGLETQSFPLPSASTILCQKGCLLVLTVPLQGGLLIFL